MRIALFIDGKNFYAGWKDKGSSKKIDFTKMAAWLVKQAGGSHMWGAFYYTGIETGSNANSEGQQKLIAFLDMIEMQPGYYVKRFPRKSQSFQCEHCGKDNHYTQEKEVDTTMVADMLRMAAVDAFDILVLVSGDADYTPALEGVQAIGKQTYVATWSGAGLSSRIRKAAYAHIDLINGLDEFGYTDDSVHPESCNNENEPSYSIEDEYDVFVSEVKRAQQKFEGGYVGASYFVSRWGSDLISNSPNERRKILDHLVEQGRIDLYDAPDGKKAIRVKE